MSTLYLLQTHHKGFRSGGEALIESIFRIDQDYLKLPETVSAIGISDRQVPEMKAGRSILLVASFKSLMPDRLTVFAALKAPPLGRFRGYPWLESLSRLILTR